MDISIFLAKAFSIYFLIMGITMILRRRYVQEMVNAFYDSKSCLFLAAIITIVLGIILVLIHSAFTPDWRSVITALAWITLLKGILYLLTPNFIVTVGKSVIGRGSFVFSLVGIACLILAIFLGYHAFLNIQ